MCFWYFYFQNKFLFEFINIIYNFKKLKNRNNFLQIKRKEEKANEIETVNISKI